MGDHRTSARQTAVNPSAGPDEAAQYTSRGFARGVVEVCRLAIDVQPRAFVAMSVVGVIAAAIPPVTVLLSATLAAQLQDGATERGKMAVVVAALWLLAIGQRLLAVVTAHARGAFVRQAQYAIEARLLQRVTQAPLRQFDDPEWQDRLARAKGDLNWKPGDAMWAALAMSSHAVALALMVLLVAKMHWTLSVMAVASALVATRVERRMLVDQFKQRSDDTSTQRERDYLGAVLTDPGFAGDLRAYDASGRLLSRHEALTRRLVASAKEPARRSRAALLLSALVGGSAVGASYAAIAYGALGRRDAGAIVLVVGAFGAVSTALTQLTSAMLTVEHHGRFLEDLTQFLRTPREEETAKTTVRATHRANDRACRSPSLEIASVTFTYPGSSSPTLSGLSLTVERGECVAIVGPNGAGKSTLAKLLLGFYEPDSGQIFIDGEAAANMSKGELRRKFGVQLQGLPIYEVPIAEFVAFGRPEGDDGDIVSINDAIARAECRPIVERAACGTATRLGRRFPGGQAVSGGEWQRLELARTIHRGAGIWLLDEPTAHLDASAQRALQRVIASRPPDVTVVLVTHHWPVVAMAGRVAVMRAGRIVEEGQPRRLVRESGALVELFGAQALQ